jgi:hypothetical protein
MRLHLHSTRREALTVSETTLTRWSLADNVPSRLLEVSTAPHPLLDFTILQDGRLVIFGGVIHAPDGESFALNSTNPQQQKYTDPCVIEVRHWESLALATTITIPQAFGPPRSMAISPVKAGEIASRLETGRPDQTNSKERISENVGDENADQTAPEPDWPWRR